MSKQQVIDILKLAYNKGLITKNEYFTIGKQSIEQIDINYIKQLEEQANNIID
jgi:hypothetical protein